MKKLACAIFVLTGVVSASAGTTPAQRASAQLVTEPDGVFFGRVLDESTGAPIPNAKVRCASSSDSRLGDGIAAVDPRESTTSDADGRFRVSYRTSRRPHARIDAPGFGSFFVETLRLHSTPERALDVFLPRTATVRGRVTDTVAGRSSLLRVRLRADGESALSASSPSVYDVDLDFPELRWEATVAADGSFELPGVASRTAITVEFLVGADVVARSFDPLVLMPGETRIVERALGSLRSVRGRIVDVQGVAVVDRQVWLVPSERGSERVFRGRSFPDARSFDAVANAAGEFVFPAVPVGRWLAGLAPDRSASIPDRVDVAVQPVTLIVEDARAPAPLSLQAERGVYVSGRVVDSHGAPASEASVTAWSEEVRWTVESDATHDGSFVLGPLLPGRYGLSASLDTTDDSGRERDVEECVSKADAGAEDVRLQLARLTHVRGRVTLGPSESANDVSVAYALQLGGDGASMGWSRCTAQGAFDFDALAPATCCFFAYDLDGRTSALHTLQLESKTDVSGFELELKPGALVSVRYVGNAASATFRVFQGSTWLNISYTISGSGQGEFVLPPGEFRVTCLREAPDGSDWPVREQLVRLAAGDTKTLVFTDG